VASRRPARAPRRPADLSVAQALAALAVIDLAIDAYPATAPAAVRAMGGRPAIQAACQMTCVGPVPRLPEDTWAAMAEEHGRAPWEMARLLA
jgi:hypothetical protein